MQKFVLGILALLSLNLAALGAVGKAQKIGNVDTSTWRGFNLCEKFKAKGQSPFLEDDFKWIHELAFNYVRLPVDYLAYTEPGDWLKFKEPVLKDFDQAIEFGNKYDIHISLNLHRAPGFCINPPEEASNLWTNKQTLEVFIAHWVMFAKRFKHVPPERLSFNLLNEPTRTTREDYLRVFCRTIEAIHQEDPRRLVIVDGLNVGKEALPEFLKYDNVIQATRGYHPGTISHYKASWSKGSDKWPEPTWPIIKIAGYLYGPVKSELRSPLTITGNFKSGTEISFKVFQVSSKAKIVAQANGKTVAEKMFDPKLNPADWKKAQGESKYVYMEPTGEMLFKVTLPANTHELSLDNVDGDWLKFNELTIRLPDGKRYSYTTDMSYGRKQGGIQIASDGRLLPPPGVPTDYQLKEYLQTWLDISAKGETVFVGEWGCYNKTPHPVALAWMKSWMENWKQAGFGWALWNFRGSFGILDSGRTDIQYEDWHGHKLDREMLNLLQQYLKY
jgi:hypothetical protein